MGCKNSTMHKEQPAAPSTKAQAALVAEIAEATTVTVAAEPAPVAREPSPVATAFEEQQQHEAVPAAVPAAVQEEPAAAAEPEVAAAPAPVSEPEAEAEVEVEVEAEEPAEDDAEVDAAAMRALSPLSPKRELNVMAAPKRKVVFDAETLRKTAPKKQKKAGSTMTKKQRELLRTQHVSVGRKGPVPSRWDKCQGNMQTDVYLQMTAAFERLLTNASTLNAHLDTR